MPSCGNLCERRASAFSYAISGCAAAILSVLASLTDTAVPLEQTIKNVVIAFVFWNSYFRGIFLKIASIILVRTEAFYSLLIHNSTWIP